MGNTIVVSGNTVSRNIVGTTVLYSTIGLSFLVFLTFLGLFLVLSYHVYTVVGGSYHVLRLVVIRRIVSTILVSRNIGVGTIGRRNIS
jgi:hypothetical protein